MKRFILLMGAMVIFLGLAIPQGAAALSRPSYQLSDFVPAGMVIPEQLPAGIHDPIILAGWVYLYNQPYPLRTWDGSRLNGQMIAQYVLDHQVVIEWNPGNICQGYSCTIPPSCAGDDCQVAEGENDGKIFITLTYRDPQQVNIAELAGTLAHELYHHRLPFGAGANTLFEEYWAYSIGSEIYQPNRHAAEAYDPMKPACLAQWIESKGLDNYANFELYPPAVKLPAGESERECQVVQRLPGEVSQ